MANQVASKFDRVTMCYRRMPPTSSGLWFKDDPLKASLPILLLQMSVIVGSSRVLHSLCRHLGQSEAFSQMLTGVLLGPNVAGKLRGLPQTFFPERSWVQLDTVGFVGYNLFVFTIGVKTDLSMLRLSGRKAVAVGLIGAATSIWLVLLGARWAQHLAPHTFSSGLAYNVATTWTQTSFPVLCIALTELNLLNSKLGQLALSASLITDVGYVVGTSALRSLQLSSEANQALLVFGIVASFFVLIAFIWLVVRPLTLWMIRGTPEGAPLSQTHFIVVIMIGFGCGVVSELIGHHAFTGMFLCGVALPSGPPLGSTLARRLEGLVGNLFIPVFMAMPGFMADFSQLKDIWTCGYTLTLILLSTVGKAVGVMLPCLFCRMSLRDAFTVALMMNIKGINELNSLDMWSDQGMVDGQTYVTITYTILASQAIIMPMLKALYKPHTRYVGCSWRTSVQDALQEGTELRVMVCVHGEVDVPPAVNLLQALHDTRLNPLAVYVLHLVQLVGRAAPLLAPHSGGGAGAHRGNAQSDAGSTPTDRIANAFRIAQGGGLVQTFVGISPYASMHNDICALALEKAASLLVIPFHKKMAIDGKIDAANTALHGVNLKVLDYAPCSVGILVDRRLPNGGGSYAAAPNNALRRVAMCFLGGPDDREALACVARAAENPGITVVVARFRLPEQLRDHVDKEQALDDEAVNEFRFSYVNNSDAVLFRDEVVQDGEEMVGVIRAMSSYFGLFVVGRRRGAPETPLIAGMSTWSDYPELGVLGDMLASADFGSKISTLVVQVPQRTRVVK